MTINKFYNLGKNKLFTINRSITGKGTLKTLKIIKQNFPGLKIGKFKSGTKVFDWTVPPEWNVSDAYILDKNNKKIVDIEKNNLHLIGYSIPVNKVILKKELSKKLHSISKQPSAIPYLTSYYEKKWGFCITDNFRKKYEKKYEDQDKFKVVIKSSFKKKGVLNYGEFLIPGKSKKEILISTYICHPSMANNELSGPIVSMLLINFFKKYKRLNKSLRFLFIPETIGSIAYLSKNLEMLKKNVIGGFNLSCIGDERQHSCMLSKYKNTQSDLAIIEAYKTLKIKYKIYPFTERGSDERQYNSPGVDLPIASIFRTKYNEFPEYHTSLDDFKLVTKKGIKGGYKVARKAVEILLKKIIPKATIICEPQLGKRKLYQSLSNKSNYKNRVSKKLLSFLQYSDGRNNMEQILKFMKVGYREGNIFYKLLKNKKLLD